MPDLPDDAAVAREIATGFDVQLCASMGSTRDLGAAGFALSSLCTGALQDRILAAFKAIRTAERTAADARVAEERRLSTERIAAVRRDAGIDATLRLADAFDHEGPGAIARARSAAMALERSLAQPAGQEMEEPSKVVLHTLTDEEQAARMAALEDARLRERAANIRADADERRKRLRRALADPRPGEPEGER